MGRLRDAFRPPQAAVAFDEEAKWARIREGLALAWGARSGAGKTVTVDAALQMSAVWACIKITAQAVSSLPLALYERRGDNDRVRTQDDPLAEVISESPNADQTALEFWEEMAAWLLTRGNAFAEQTWARAPGKADRLVALQPLPGARTAPHRRPDGELVYRVTDRGQVEELPRDKVFHVRGFGQGLQSRDLGLSPIASGVHSIGAAMAAQEAAATTFANGMRPTGFFLFDQELKPHQRQQAQDNLVAPLQGSGKAGGVGVLEAGVKWQSVSLNPEDAQLLLTRRFDVEEVCRWFGVPPIVIGHAGEGQTMWGSGVEQILITWLTLGIDPICDRIEARVRKDLIRRAGHRRRYAEFNREALLQMDAKSKAMFLSQMVQNGLMSRNEGRSKLNLPRVEGGDELTVQTNLSPLGTQPRAPGTPPSAVVVDVLKMLEGEE